VLGCHFPQKSYLLVISNVSAKFWGIQYTHLDTSKYYTKMIKRAVHLCPESLRLFCPQLDSFMDYCECLYKVSKHLNAHNKCNEKRAVPYALGCCISPLVTAVLPQRAVTWIIVNVCAIFQSIWWIHLVPVPISNAIHKKGRALCPGVQLPFSQKSYLKVISNVSAIFCGSRCIRL